MSEADGSLALRQAIAALQAQRVVLGDAVVDAALQPLQAQLLRLGGGTAPAPTSAEPRLRLVSVLFLDVVGSTSLSQHLDPEDISEVMDGLLARCTGIVERQGGSVLQYAGDSLLAAFGASEAREDDAERAVHAGLALLQEGRLAAGQVQQRHGLDGFDVRVGVHTGSVLLGGGVDAEGTIRGITVNIAARMEQTAPPGTLRISHDTYHQVRGNFDVQAQPPLEVKGVDQPIASYLVQRAKPRAFHLGRRGQGGTPTPLIGRSHELAHLTAACDQVLADGRPRQQTLLADAGLGKSRLLQELLQHLELHSRRCWLLLARCHPSSELEPYGVLRALLVWRLEIADSDQAPRVRSKLLDGLVPLLEAAGRASEPARVDALCIGVLAGFEVAPDEALQGEALPPKRLRERALQALRLLLRGLAGADATPVVMLLEDLHWADEASLDWLQGLLSEPPDAPVLMLMSARPALLQRRPGWGDDAPAHHLLTLTPLPEAQRPALTAALLGRLPEPPPELLRRIERQAEGNPYFAEELVQMLRDQRVIVDDADGHWAFDAAALTADRLPVTLTGVLQARLDALEPAERHALQMASVIGPVFWDEALEALAPGAAAALPALQRKGMLLSRPQSRFEGSAERAFHHHLLHQVTYDTLLKSARRSSHARAAAWLQARAGDRSEEILAITAEHFERAGDGAGALRWFSRAARQASSVDAVEAALRHGERALAQRVEGAVEERIVVMLRMSALFDTLGDYERMRQALDQAMPEIEAAGAHALRLRAISARLQWADRVGDDAQAAALAVELAQAAEQAGDAQRAFMAWGNLAWQAKEREAFDEALVHLARARHWVTVVAQERPGDQADLLYTVQALQVEAAIVAQAGDDDRCLQALEEAHPITVGMARDRRALVNNHLALAQVARRRGDWTLAREHASTGEAMAREIPVPRTQWLCRLEAARVALDLEDDVGAAATWAREAADALDRIGAGADASTASMVAAQACACAGLAGDALAYAQKALRGFEAMAASASATGSAQLLAAGYRTLLRQREEGVAELRAMPAERWAACANLDRFDADLALAAYRAALGMLIVGGDPEAAATAAALRSWAAQALQRRLRRSADPAVQARLTGLPLHRALAELCGAEGPGVAAGAAGA